MDAETRAQAIEECVLVAVGAPLLPLFADGWQGASMVAGACVPVRDVEGCAVSKSAESPLRGGRWDRSYEGRRVIVYLRISRDPENDRRGVTTQAGDCEAWVRAHGGVLVWDALDKAENNTSAFKKKRVRVPDGENGWRWALRVWRPRWEEALRMMRAGEADTLLVVNQDR